MMSINLRILSVVLLKVAESWRTHKFASGRIISGFPRGFTLKPAKVRIFKGKSRDTQGLLSIDKSLTARSFCQLLCWPTELPTCTGKFVSFLVEEENWKHSSNAWQHPTGNRRHVNKTEDRKTGLKASALAFAADLRIARSLMLWMYKN